MNVYYLERAANNGEDGTRHTASWIVKKLDHGLNLENRVILGCAGGNAPCGRQVLALLLSDKSVALLWYPPGPASLNSPYVSAAVTATYRKASAAVISDGVFFVADRFGSIYTHDLARLEGLVDEQSKAHASPSQVVQFVLDEPVLGRCSTVTSLSAGAGGSIYFGDRDGILLETRADAPHAIRYIWSNRNEYIEQSVAWSGYGALSYGNFGLFYNHGSSGTCQSQLLLEHCVLDAPSGPTLQRCIGIACSGSAAYAASLHIVARACERAYIAEDLVILRVDMLDEKAALTPLFTHTLELPVKAWEADQPSLSELAREDILRTYSVTPLQHSVSSFPDDAVPIFMDSLGTLFSCTGRVITSHPDFLDTKAIQFSVHTDPLTIEHASHRVKL